MNDGRGGKKRGKNNVTKMYIYFSINNGGRRTVLLFRVCGWHGGESNHTAAPPMAPSPSNSAAVSDSIRRAVGLMAPPDSE